LPTAKDPQVVTLRFRGLRSDDVSPHWFSEFRTQPGNQLKQPASVRPSVERSALRTSRTAPLLRLRPLQGTTQRGPPTSRIARPVGPAIWVRSATPMEFLAPSTLEPGRVHSPPVCRTGYVPPSGFLTLSTAYSSPGRPALFHADNAHGVLGLSRGLPSPSARRDSSPPRCPPGVCSFAAVNASIRHTARRRRSAASLSRRSSTYWSPPGLCSDGESVPPNGCYAESLDGRSPPELSVALQGFNQHHRPRRAQRLRSCALSRSPPTSRPDKPAVPPVEHGLRSSDSTE
jgi:hypothetical protein